ncbi:MAG: LysM peptidoglycan-binding domain-containing protein [Litorilinea sp.]
MAREQISPAILERRCPNCGTRVAQDAESCFMCGHDLRAPVRGRRRFSWIDALLVIAVLAVLGVWWSIASQPRQEVVGTDESQALLPTNIPLLTATPEIDAAAAVDVPPTPVASVREDGVVRHTVQGGETLLAIAALYEITVDEIQAANDLDSVLIRAGDELIIPITREATAGDGETVASTFEYTVLAGDSIISIANRFGSTPEDILRANGLTGENPVIRAGDVINVPVPQVPQEVLASGAVALAPDGSLQQSLYAEPRVIGPPDATVIERAEPVLLRWISVDVLQPNEWYVLLIYPLNGAAQEFPSIWTKATSYRLDSSFAPEGSDTAEYAWQVSVVRVRPGAGDRYALDAASPTSELRNFSWR